MERVPVERWEGNVPMTRKAMATTDLLRRSLRRSEQRMRREMQGDEAGAWIQSSGQTSATICASNVAYTWDSQSRKRLATGNYRECGHLRKRHGSTGCLDCPKLSRHHTFEPRLHAPRIEHL